MNARALIAVLLLSACKPTATGPADTGPQAKELTLLAVADVGSDTDVCGCKAHPLGGVTRWAALAKARGPQALLVDGGDLYFRTWSISPRYEPQARETALFWADTQRDLKVAAMAVGERDLALGLPFLRQLSQRSGTPLLAANLVHSGSATAAFDAFTLVERNGIKVGLIGAAPELPPGAQAQQVYRLAGLETVATLPALQKASAAAKQAGAELVVGLLHVGQTRAVELLSALPAGTIDFAIVGHDRQSGPLQVIAGGKTGLVLGGERGKYLIATSLELRPQVHLWLDESAVTAQERQIAALAERLAVYRNEDAGPQDQGDRAATVGRLERRKLELEAELATLDRSVRNRISTTLLEVKPELPGDPVTEQRYAAYQDRLQIVNTGAPVPNRAEINYLGNAGCQTCHPQAITQWSKTGHARAWATMERTRQTANLDCIPCHVTGFDRPGGPAQIVGLERFVNVGCESCHGPGSAHAANPKVQLDYGRQVPEKVCAECHRAQADQKPFVYEARLPLVLGPGHGVKLPKR